MAILDTMGKSEKKKKPKKKDIRKLNHAQF